MRAILLVMSAKRRPCIWSYETYPRNRTPYPITLPMGRLQRLTCRRIFIGQRRTRRRPRFTLWHAVCAGTS